mmetsp:Transcript_40712/g.73559  ORF Transcript_40712/g.73559 Transcript_40712/m.73559 type:complete len:452 (-) Transcript_40712:47-1402(-)
MGDEALRPPFHVKGGHIVDANGQRVHLYCVNWSGAEQKDGVVAGLQHQPVGAIARWIQDHGFTCVRLPWSVWMVETNPAVDASRLQANPQLLGRRALDIFDAVVQALAGEGLMVVLDNHMSDGDWCCSDTDGNGLWYTDRWPEEMWLQSHRHMALRYRSEAHVIGMELRNELRRAEVQGRWIDPTWGSGNKTTDWKRAATLGYHMVKSHAESWIVFVDGLNYSSNFQDIAADPLPFPDVVYAPHVYPWFHGFTNATTNYSMEELQHSLNHSWAPLLQDTEHPHAIWISEFGTSHTSGENVIPNHTWTESWWHLLSEYVNMHDLDWAYWRLDGTESNGSTRVFNAVEPYGILNATWDGAAGDGLLLTGLQTLAKRNTFAAPSRAFRLNTLKERSDTQDHPHPTFGLIGGVFLLGLIALLYRCVVIVNKKWHRMYPRDPGREAEDWLADTALE